MPAPPPPPVPTIPSTGTSNDFHHQPNGWVEVSVVNDRQDVEAGNGWFSVSNARLGDDLIDVRHGPVPSGAVPDSRHDLENIRLGQATYFSEFDYSLQDGRVMSQRCQMNPCTMIRAKKGMVAGRMVDGILTLVIDQNRRTNTFHLDGSYDSRREHSIDRRYLQLALLNGKLSVIGGDYQVFVKKIIFRFGIRHSPVSVMLVMYSQEEAKRLLQLKKAGIEAVTAVEVIEGNEIVDEYNTGEDVVDGLASSSYSGDEMPLWMMESFAGMALESSMMQVEQELVFSYSF